MTPDHRVRRSHCISCTHGLGYTHLVRPSYLNGFAHPFVAFLSSHLNETQGPKRPSWPTVGGKSKETLLNTGGQGFSRRQAVSIF